MSTQTIKTSLAKIESMLATIVGGTTTKRMRPTDFVSYAHGQIAKAMTEEPAASTRRLKALHRSVVVFKDNYSADDDGVNVPIYENDVTSMDDKSSSLTTPAAAAGSNPDGETVFEDGLVAKLAEFKTALSSLFKGDGKGDGKDGDGDGDEEEEEEEEEKRKAAAAAPKKGDGAPDDIAEGDDEEEEKRKAKAGEPPAAAGEKPTAKRVKKGVDVSADGTQWPSDLNDPAFQKDGKVEKALDWGNDPA